ncbi:low affinity iron permease family protein [Bdellovibrio sp. SKB1291214]|uniref:low affinity iron permease family protein n=1 Tax=Bdellovibrio sp. SKB1291214 TaxID=1732569 RepID=UPI000B5174B8|nr:low affinity iron permease family protein [Bdellovibrio sp. SKB1291214]UYL09248.1 low affinity iron permease family protein [Bdellovibrio sp. SKB1291214]
MNELFRKISNQISHWVGTPYAFVLAVGGIILWAVLGPVFDYSDTWQLVINTATTIITFLMVFLIQNTQNRDARAIHLKLDELIRATNGARDDLIDLEEMSDDMLDQVHADFRATHERMGEVIEKIEAQKKNRQK